MGLYRKLFTGKSEISFEDIQFDDAALEMFFESYFEPLCAYCKYRFNFDIDQAKETVHIAFIRLWENRNSVSPDLSLKAYMYKIVTNISLDVLRHQKVKEKHERFVVRNSEEAAIFSDYSSTDYKILKNDINRAVEELPQQMRIIFELSRYENLKYAEIAERLNISVKTVETQMSRALSKLRQKLVQYLSILFFIWLINNLKLFFECV